MTNPDSSDSLKLSRRRFGQILLLSGIGCVASQATFPGAARADSLEEQQGPWLPAEKYHIYIGRELAEHGGQHPVTFRSGEKKAISIPPNSTDGTKIKLTAATLNDRNASICLHTLYDPEVDIRANIETAISRAPIMQATKERCLAAYQQLESGEHVLDSDVLNVLDIAIAGDSKLAKTDKGELIQTRYQIASQNSRLIVLQACVEDKIAAANLSPEETQKLRGLFQFVRAGEALPGQKYLDDLTAIDAMVQDSALPVTLKQLYTIASAQTRAYTVDEVILDLIQRSPYIADKREQFLETYNEARLGKKVRDEYTLGSLDSLVYLSGISPECKAIYKLSRDRFYEQDDGAIEASLRDYFDQAQTLGKQGGRVIPVITSILSATGATASTGTAISVLSGGAATNATLAFIGGGSVAAGGLGMLGGLAIATGGSALVGAAAIASLIKVGSMSNAEKKRLGISTAIGSMTSAAIVGSAWVAVSTFGAAGTLTGAAAISSSIAALGGVSFITGGAALLAFGVSLGVWKLLSRHKDVEVNIQQLEPWLYTRSEESISKTPMVQLLSDHLTSSEEAYEAYLAPNIPFDKLSNSLKHYIAITPDERILALIDTTIFNNAKEGIAFTNKGIWWKNLSKPHFLGYADPDYVLKVGDLPKTTSEEQTRSIKLLALTLGKEAALKEISVL